MKTLRFLHSDRLENERGHTIFELMVAFMIVAVLSATAVSNLKVTENPLADATFETAHFMKLVRARAISQTTYLKVSPSSTTKMIVQSGTSCATGTTYTTISDFLLVLPAGSRFSATTWSACFNPRGQASANVTFTIQDTSSGKTRTIEIALGGATQER